MDVRSTGKMLLSAPLGRTGPFAATDRICASARLAAVAETRITHCGKVVPGDGVEPPTLRFSVACSTN